MIRQSILCGLGAAILCNLATTSHADEKSATDAIRNAGGSVRTIAKKVTSKEVALHLADKDVTDAVLANLPQIPEIAWLNLRGTKITDAGLAHVGKIASLTHLHLELTGVGDAGLAHLKGLANLEYLNLYGTQVTDAGLAHLAGLKKLKKLYVWQSKVTPKAAETFAKTMPGLVINTGANLAAPVVAKPVEPLKTPPKKSLAKGQFVRIRHEGDGKILSLAEVEVLQTGDGAPLHRKGKATQSSVSADGKPERAIDGNLKQDYASNSVTHTATEKNPWWMVDLGGVKDIGRIHILSRADNLEARLEGAVVEVLDSDQKKVVYTVNIKGVSKQALEGK